MARPKRRTQSADYIEVSDDDDYDVNGDNSDSGDVRPATPPRLRSTRAQASGSGGDTGPRRLDRATRVTRPMKEAGSDIEFGDQSRVASPTPSRRPRSQFEGVVIPSARARNSRNSPPMPRTTFLGVFIPKMRPTAAMIREYKEKQAWLASSSVLPPPSPEQSDVEDELDIDNDLGAALKLSTSSKEGPVDKGKQRAATPEWDVPAPKRGRGRPRKHPLPDPNAPLPDPDVPKRKRGRPRKRPASPEMDAAELQSEGEILPKTTADSAPDKQPLFEPGPEDDDDNDEVEIPKRKPGRPSKRTPPNQDSEVEVIEIESSPPKKKVGRPSKSKRLPSEEESDDVEKIPKRKPGRPRKRPPSDEGESDIASPPKKKRGRPRKRPASDSSESDRPVSRNRRGRRLDGAETEEEDEDEIELDEPERFKSKSRLRQVKKSAFQSRLSSLKKDRAAKVFGAKRQSSSEDEESESESEESSSEDDRKHGGRAGPSGGGGHTGGRSGHSKGPWRFVEDDLSDFIASDDDVDGQRGARAKYALPEEFSLRRESPEYKFKVVFQYFVVMVIKGPGILPLKGEDDRYFGAQLRDVRNQMNGLKNSIASVLWTSEFLEALKRYPKMLKAKLQTPKSRCEACNKTKQGCRQEAWLRGLPYHPDTHQDVADREVARLKHKKNEMKNGKSKGKGKKRPSNSDSDSDSDTDSEDDMREIGPLGEKCQRRTQLYHEIHHWEHTMYNYVRDRYHDLLRVKDVSFSDDSLESGSDDTDGETRRLKKARDVSKNRRAEIKKGPLVKDIEDPDEVTEWMDTRGFQLDMLKYLGRLSDRVRELQEFKD